MINIKKNIKKGIALGLATILLGSASDADILYKNTDIYNQEIKNDPSRFEEISKDNRHLNKKGIELAIENIKQDIEFIDKTDYYVADRQEIGFDGFYYHSTNDIVIINNPDLTYLNEIEDEKEKMEYIQLEIEDRESTVYHEIGHLLTIHHLSYFQIEEYKEIYSYDFKDDDDAEWEEDLWENIAEDIAEYFTNKYYDDVGYTKMTINEDMERDQEKLNDWIETVIKAYNQVTYYKYTDFTKSYISNK